MADRKDSIDLLLLSADDKNGAIDIYSQQLNRLFEQVQATKKAGQLTLTVSITASGENFLTLKERLSLTVPTVSKGDDFEQTSSTIRTRLSEHKKWIADNEEK